MAKKKKIIRQLEFNFIAMVQVGGPGHSRGSTAAGVFEVDLSGTYDWKTQGVNSVDPTSGLKVEEEFEPGGLADFTTLEVIWSPENGDVIENSETVIFNVQYYVISPGEVIDNGNLGTGTGTYTQTGTSGDMELIETTITLNYDSADQAIVVADSVFVQFNRDFTNDTYAGDACVHRWEAKYTATGIAYH